MGLQDFFVRDRKKAEPKPAEQAAPAAPVTVRDPAEKVDIIDALLEGKEIVSKVETGYGVFEIKYPNGADRLRIAHRRATYLGGHSDDSFDRTRRFQFEMWATLDVLVVSSPGRFKGIESWADFPDADLTEEVYDQVARFCREIGQRIRTARPGQPKQVDNSEDAGAPMGN